MDEELARILELANELRPGYRASLGQATGTLAEACRSFWRDPIPELAQVIYGTVAGTRREVSDQALMDLTPGYRLIHVEELAAAHRALRESSERADLFPVLADYGNCFVCTDGRAVYDVDDTGDVTEMHACGLDFLRTIAECYAEGAYELDEDGYLDSDSDAEEAIGARLNPRSPYWND